MVVAQGGN
jgi:hypothetical protein